MTSAAASLLVFSYGSNLCLDRLRRRTPSAEPVGIGTLAGHDLRWHKVGKDGSGKCDAYETGDPDDVVWGAVVRIAAGERPELDRAEHLGIGYRAGLVNVTLQPLGSTEAWIYTALQIDPSLRPFDWYRAYVLAGACAMGLPEPYVEAIRRVRTRRDPEAARARRHWRALAQQSGPQRRITGSAASGVAPTARCRPPVG